MSNVKLNTTIGLVQNFNSIASLIEHYNEHGQTYDFRLNAAGELCLYHKGHRTTAGVIVAQNGHVQHGDTVIVLTQNAYASNYGTDGGVRYYASGIDAAGNEYTVAWDTTTEWTASDAICRAEADTFLDADALAEKIAEIRAEFGLPDDFSAYDCSDESWACDWDSPAEITAL